MLGVQYLSQTDQSGNDKNQKAHELLMKGLKLAENNDHGLAMTYNNLANYYRK